MAIKKVRMKPPGYTDIVHPETSADVVIEDSSHRFVTDSEKGIWNSKETTSGAQSKVDAHAGLKNNPHSVTKSQVGLGNVDNTSDANKPISSLQQAGLNLKADKTEAQLFKLTGDLGTPKTFINDANLALDSGVYGLNSGAINIPSGVSLSLIVTYRRNSDTWIFQTFYDTNDRVFVRRSGNNGSTWSNWRELAAAVNAIVETGSNDNGYYVKFGDGTMICYTLLMLVYQTPDYLSLSGNTPWTYPEAFVGTPAALATKSEAWVSSSLIRSTVATSPSSSTCRVRLYAAEGNPFVSGNSYQVSIAVIGRWK